MPSFFANGKLLLSGEYFVLDGALALALPTKMGQSMSISINESTSTPALHWQSYNNQNQCWFECNFDPKNLQIRHATNATIAKQLQIFLQKIKEHNPSFLMKNAEYELITHLDFPNNWGLGSSSTLISCLADWAKINPFKLLFETMGGSGYDIACAKAKQPILYQFSEEIPCYAECCFDPPFKENLYFVYLRKKQDSREGIARYRNSKEKKMDYFAKISTLTMDFVHCKNLEKFEKIIQKHEKIVAKIINMPRAKASFFPDFWGEIKSLGAWGGDFVLATSDKTATKTKNYFVQKGFDTVLNYTELAISNDK